MTGRLVQMFFTTVQMQTEPHKLTASQAGPTASLHVNRFDILEETLCCCWSSDHRVYVPPALSLYVFLCNFLKELHEGCWDDFLFSVNTLALPWPFPPPGEFSGFYLRVYFVRHSTWSGSSSQTFNYCLTEPHKQKLSHTLISPSAQIRTPSLQHCTHKHLWCHRFSSIHCCIGESDHWAKLLQLIPKHLGGAEVWTLVAHPWNDVSSPLKYSFRNPGIVILEYAHLIREGDLEDLHW